MPVVGTVMLRYSLVFFLLLFGAAKWTRDEAVGIQSMMANSPLMFWLYRFFSIQGASIVIGVVELTLAATVASRRFFPKGSAWGSTGAILMFLTTISFLDLRSQGFLMKDLVLLGAAVYTAGEAFTAHKYQREAKMMKPISDSQFGSIRLVEKRDAAALIDLIVAIDLFPPEEVGELREIIGAYLNGDLKGEFWLVDDDAVLGLSGVAYCAPERMTHGTWNLFLIGVHAQRRRQGRGTRRLQRTEDLLRERGIRILIVETSSTDGFEDTRRFYTQTGYTEQARVPDFYKDGEDKVVFWKSLRHG